MKVPFLDLKAQYESIKDQINDAIQQVLDSCAFAGGPFVEKFEKEFAEFCGCDHCIGVGSGTEALWLALIALGVGHGDEVITVPNTFIATAEAISFCGATPVFVDIDEKTYAMDPQKLEDYLQTGNRPKAVIPVHLFGQMADMDPIMAISRKYGLYVIEDACQAHGATYKGKPAGSIGDAGCFSFYPGKNLGAYGEAGAVTTNKAELAEKIAILKDHGQTQKYHHKWIGWNGRMDGILGGGFSLVRSKEHLVPIGSNKKIKVMTMILEKGDIRMLGSYFFLQMGRVITNPWMNKFYLIWNGITKQRTDGALVRAEMTVAPEQTLEAAYVELEGFIENLWPILPKYVPE